MSKASNRCCSYGLGITLSLIVSQAISAPAVNAKTFIKLVERGQIVSDAPITGNSNNQPIESIGDATIGRDGQTAVFLRKKTEPRVEGPPRPGFNGINTYLGIYSITKGGKISLINQGFREENSQFLATFTDPSISEGLIAYGTYITGPSMRGGFQPPISDLRVGTPGEIKFYPSIFVFGRGDGIPKISFADGLVYALERSTDVNSANQSTTLRVINTKVPGAQFTTLSSDPSNREIRTSSRSLVLLSVSAGNVYRLFERPHDGQFAQLNPIGNNPGSCGFAVSYENIVSCSAEGGKSVLSARFGATGTFIKVPLANEAATQSISSPSISQKKILFLANEQLPNQAPTQTIYVSNNGGPSTPVIRTGDILDGRSVVSLSLSSNGRAISDNSAVFVATFENFQEALFRVDL